MQIIQAVAAFAGLALTLGGWAVGNDGAVIVGFVLVVLAGLIEVRGVFSGRYTR